MPLDMMRLWRRRFPSLPYLPRPFDERGLPQYHEFLVGIVLAVALHSIYACVWRLQIMGFVQAPTFSRSFQLHQIQRVTGSSCTKRVPFRYRFDEKPPVIVGATTGRFSLARILKPAAAGRR